MEREVSPRDIRFTQNSIARKFKKPYQDITLDAAVTMLTTRQRSPAFFKQIVVVDYESQLWSVNNRRLWVFRKAKVSRISVRLLNSSSEVDLQALINSPRGRALTQNDKDNLHRFIDDRRHRTKLGTADFLPVVRWLKKAKSSQASKIKPSLQNSNTKSSSSVPIPDPVQPNLASANASTMTQLPQSRQPLQDRGSTGRSPTWVVKRPKIPVIDLGSNEIRCPLSTHSTGGASDEPGYRYSTFDDQACSDHDEEAIDDQACSDHDRKAPGFGSVVQQALLLCWDFMGLFCDCLP